MALNHSAESLKLLRSGAPRHPRDKYDNDIHPRIHNLDDLVESIYQDLEALDAQTINEGNVIYVDKIYGNDTSAASSPHSIETPFASLTAANTASTEGDIIIVRPGSYNTYNTTTNTYPRLGKNGVNWHFMAGAEIEAVFDDEGTTRAILFQDKVNLLKHRMMASLSLDIELMGVIYT